MWVGLSGAEGHGCDVGYGVFFSEGRRGASGFVAMSEDYPAHAMVRSVGFMLRSYCGSLKVQESLGGEEREIG